MSVRPQLLLILAVLLGLGAAASSVTVPVTVAVVDDPILRLVTLDPSTVVSAESVTCGSPREGLQPTPGPVSFENLARDRACRNASLKRLAAAGASGALVVAVGLLGLVGGSGRVGAP